MYHPTLPCATLLTNPPVVDAEVAVDAAVRAVDPLDRVVELLRRAERRRLAVLHAAMDEGPELEEQRNKNKG